MTGLRTVALSRPGPRSSNLRHRSTLALAQMRKHYAIVCSRMNRPVRPLCDIGLLSLRCGVSAAPSSLR